VWPFHHVKILSRKSFIVRPVRGWRAALMPLGRGIVQPGRLRGPLRGMRGSASEATQSIHGAYSSRASAGRDIIGVRSRNHRPLPRLGYELVRLSMEPTMINLKVLSTVAALALVLPLAAAPTASFAENHGRGGGGGAHMGGGGMRMGGGMREGG